MTDKEDLQAASVANPSRRCLFKTAAVGAAGLAVGAAGGYLVSQQSNTANAGHSTQSIDCHGAHQAGILNPAHQPCGIFTAFDITGKTRGELQKLFRIITDRIEFLTKGGKYPDAHPQLPQQAAASSASTFLLMSSPSPYQWAAVCLTSVLV